MPSVRARRPIATSSSSPLTLSPPSSSTVTSPLSPRTADALAPARTSTPASRRASLTCSPANGSSFGSRRSIASITATCGPEASPGLGHLGADGAASQHHEASRDPLRRRRIAVVPWPRVGEPIDRRNRRPRSGGDDDGPASRRGCRRRPSRAARRRVPRARGTARCPAPPAREAAPSRRGRGSPRRGGRAPLRGPAPRDRLRGAGHSSHLGERLGRAQQGLRRHARVVRALAADEVVLDDRDLEPAVGESTGADLPGGPAPITTTSNSRSLIRLSSVLGYRSDVSSFGFTKATSSAPSRSQLAPVAGEQRGSPRPPWGTSPSPVRGRPHRRPGRGQALGSPAGDRPASPTPRRAAPLAAVEGDPRSTLCTARPRRSRRSRPARA